MSELILCDEQKKETLETLDDIRDLIEKNKLAILHVQYFDTNYDGASQTIARGRDAITLMGELMIEANRISMSLSAKRIAGNTLNDILENMAEGGEQH